MKKGTAKKHPTPCYILPGEHDQLKEESPLAFGMGAHFPWPLAKHLGSDIAHIFCLLLGAFQGDDANNISSTSLGEM